MDQLPYIDEHHVHVDATPDRVWKALIAVLRASLDGSAGPVAVGRLLGATPARGQGDWRETPRPGDTLPGFEVAESRAPARLVLRGAHRFSRYDLVFELEAAGAAGCTLRARTRAAFPGLTGRGYRAMVIGTGGHRLAVRRLLRLVARRA